ncbi:hypothetical protein IFM89_017021 [Coptis chinensis]|uniref:Acid phosphatase/vanadium-dependent haloperoxidase-related protein n=1 Tax=Coptis chinensis TaxID=261450 RepID=A0A835HLH2_9MAGN|nr:hypothetical protein IFM89_017021 [Coptis chinensis]
MSSFPLNLSSSFISHNHSNPTIHFFNTHSFSFFKFTHYNKNLKTSSSVSLSYQQPPNKPSKKQCNKNPINPLWVLVPYLLQYVKETAISSTQVGVFILKSSFQKWGSCFRRLSELKKVEGDESFDLLNNGVKDMEFLQSGGIGMALLSVTSTVKLRISPFVVTLATNPTFASSMVAWMIAQSIKIVLNFCVEKRWDFRLLFASGGMPSSHSALCMALTTSVAHCHGVADSLFPVCLGFSLIVMYDAIGVRRHAGMQAETITATGLRGCTLVKVETFRVSSTIGSYVGLISLLLLLLPPPTFATPSSLEEILYLLPIEALFLKLPLTRGHN